MIGLRTLQFSVIMDQNFSRIQESEVSQSPFLRRRKSRTRRKKRAQSTMIKVVYYRLGISSRTYRDPDHRPGRSTTVVVGKVQL